MQRKIDQKALEEIILPKLPLAKEEAKKRGVQLNFRDFLTHLGFNPNLANLNFNIPNVTVKLGTPAGENVATKVYYGTELLTNIDYSGCEFTNCHFNYCNISDSTFGNQNFTDCQFQFAVLQNVTAINVGFHDCQMNRVCFDFSHLDEVEFNSVMTAANFNFLRKCEFVLFDQCSMQGISFLGGVQAQQCAISFNRKTVLEDVYLFDKVFTLQNAEIGVCKPKVGLCWNGRKPGFSAELARKAILDKQMQPILIEYQPPILDTAKLEAEVKQMSGEAKATTKQTKPFAMLEVAKTTPEKFKELMTLANYTSTTLRNLDGLVIPGGADIHPIYYGQGMHSETEPAADPRRDALEFLMLSQQQYLGIPLYGICRGSQISAIAYGAEFYQHIGDDRHYIPQKLPVPSEKKRVAYSQANSLFSRRLAPSETKTEAVSGKDVNVLYFHHQGYNFSNDAAKKNLFDVLAEVKHGEFTLTVAAESVDRNLFMVQFHPEAGGDAQLVKDKHLSTNITATFLDGFSDRVQAYSAMKERNKNVKMSHLALRHFKLPANSNIEVTEPVKQQRELALK